MGTYPAPSLAAAAAAEAAAEADRDDTFRRIAEEYVFKLKREGRAESTIKKLEWLLDFAYPMLGERSIKMIDAPPGAEGLA